MRLRKYVAGRFLGAGHSNFINRSLAFPVRVRPGEAPCFLVLRLREGAFVTARLPEDFTDPAVWPEPSIVQACADNEENELWRKFPVFTPLLRETLPELPEPERLALLVDLEAGGGGLVYYGSDNALPQSASAWEIPPAVCRRKQIVACPDWPPLPDQNDTVGGMLYQNYVSLYGFSLFNKKLFFSGMTQKQERQTRLPEKKEQKRLTRLLAKLQQEEKRLQGLADLRKQAQLLQGVIWQYAPEHKADSVVVETYDQQVVQIILNPAFSVRENMQRMFHQSARGARGLTMVAQRKLAVLSALEKMPEHAGRETATESPKTVIKQAVRQAGIPSREDGPAGSLPKLLQEIPNEEGKTKEKNIARFISSDGLTILRGKNAQGNKRLLHLAKSHDYWLHSLSGPSAHVVIRRAHAEETVPERTFYEAAVLVGLRSWQRHDAKAEVMVAQVRYVRNVKGAPDGTVLVDRRERTLMVSLEAD